MEAELDCQKRGEGGRGSVREKVRDNRGETLIEVMAAVVVTALSIALLFGTIMACTKIDQSARQSDQEHYSALTKAEVQNEGAGEVSVTVVNKGNNAQNVLKATLYGEKNVYSYAVTGGSP